MAEQSEQQKFLEDLGVKPEVDVLEKPLMDESSPEEEAEKEGDMKLKNRRERRLDAKLQAERETNIALNSRLQTLSEVKTLRETTEEADYLKRVERIYGNATPEAKEATELLKEALKGVHESAKREAMEESLNKFEADRLKETEAVKEEEKNLDSILDSLEEDYNVDMSDTAVRTGFLTMLEKLSPKDKEGNIIEYADAKEVYELYEARREKSSRAKELASRSMTRSGASQESKLEDDASVRFLKENGII